MAGSHLVIGLGGTGGRIIRALRKTLATVPEERLAGCHFDFLYVDSDAAAMNPDDPTWRVLGRSVALSPNQQLRIGGMNTQAVLGDLDRYPHLKSWVGDGPQMRTYLRENINVANGGQRRRYGRLLFAQAARDFRGATLTLKQRLQGVSGKANITVHICAGLAGGTGGGAIVDAVAQVRQHVAANAVQASTYGGDTVVDDRVLLYLVLPEEIPPGGWDSGFYHANGYAALMELNAMLVGQYLPADVAEAGELMTSLPRPAFNGAYLVTNRNMAGQIIEPEQAVPQLIADFIFQKSVTSQTEEVLRAENAENGNAADEPSVENEREPERSKRFLAFGIQRLVVPDEEVHEYFTYHFAFRAGRQFLFNNWANGIGFVDQPRNINFNPTLNDAAKLGAWLLSDEHLTLSRPILPTDGVNAQGRVIWQLIPVFWEMAKSGAVQAAMGAGKPEEWLPRVQATLAQIYGQGYRTLGVASFYQQSKQAVGKMADQVRLVVEKDLFTQWKNGQYGLADLRSLLEAVVSYLKNKLNAAEATAGKYGEQADERRASLQAAVTELTHVGIVGKLTGKNKALFNEAVVHLSAEYTLRTQAIGWQFAHVLLPEVIARLNELYDNVGEMTARVQAAVKEFERQYNSRLQTRTAAQSSPSAQGTFEHRERVFDMGQVTQIRDVLLADQQLQESTAQAFRETLFERLGPEADFTKFLTTMDAGTLQIALEGIADVKTEQAKNQLSAAQQKSLTANIVEKLAQQLGGNEDGLSKWVRDKANGAAPFCTFDTAQVGATGTGTVVPAQPPRETCVVVLPESANASGFRSALVAKFKASFPPTTVVREKHEGAPENEITVYQLRNLFPLRWLSLAKFLRGRYEQMCSPNSAAEYFVHSAGGEADYPPLFIMSPTEVAVKNVHYLLVAFALGLLNEKKDPKTGRVSLVCKYADANGFPQELHVASSMKEALKEIPLDKMLTLRTMVRNALREDRFHEAQARKQVFESIVQLVSGYMNSDLRGDPNHPQYLQLQKMAERAKREVLNIAD
jgi:hypothetical protein